MITAEQIEADLTADLTAYATGTDRSQQVETGASQLFDCLARTMFRLRGQPAEKRLAWQADVGNAIHVWIAAAKRKTRPGSVVEQSFVFKGVPATVDFIHDGCLVDWKSKDSAVEVNAMDDEDAAGHLPQLMLGAAAAREAGVRVDQVAVAFLPRSGEFTVRVFGPYAFDEQAAVAGAEWAANAEQAAASDADPRDHRGKPAYWCHAFCEFAKACRGERPAEPDLADLAPVAEEYRAAQDTKDVAAAKMKELRPLVFGASGLAGRVKVTTVPGKSGTKDVEDVGALRELWEFVNPERSLPMVQVDTWSPDKLIVKWAKK